MIWIVPMAYVLGWLISSVFTIREIVDEDESRWWGTFDYAGAAFLGMVASLFWPLTLVGWILGAAVRKTFGSH